MKKNSPIKKITGYFTGVWLEYLGIEYKLGVDFLDKASIQGRDEKDVERAIERALEHGVSQSFIEKTGGLYRH